MRLKEGSGQTENFDNSASVCTARGSVLVFGLLFTVKSVLAQLRLEQLETFSSCWASVPVKGLIRFPVIN